MTAEGDVVRLGLIGAGPWGRNYIRTIAAMDGVRLTRIASRNPESARLAGPGVTIAADWRTLLAAGDLDGVIVAAPPARHAEMTLAAIDAGIPVLVEKPMALGPDDARAVLALAQARNAIVKVDHIHLYSAAWQALKREAGTLGPVRAVMGEAGRWGPFRRDATALWEWGPHDVAMCVDLMGRVPKAIAARRLEARHTADGPGETLELDLGFGDARATIMLSNLLPERRRRFAVTLEKGALVYDDSRDQKLVKGKSWATADQAVPLPPGRPLERAVRSFADAIRRGLPDAADAQLGCEVVGLLARLDTLLGAP